MVVKLITMVKLTLIECNLINAYTCTKESFSFNSAFGPSFKKKPTPDQMVNSTLTRCLRLIGVKHLPKSPENYYLRV